ncbi:hypothetical protein BB561_000819 [Smittium simulii]|uniref:Alkaline phosphatase n=1 Tax=Smittium simulii TaxID=133385 RepID=A0A2T9YXF5_9FUNG|nr:hypothetical protein BB561_000819 [Smittium simulii]
MLSPKLDSRTPLTSAMSESPETPPKNSIEQGFLLSQQASYAPNSSSFELNTSSRSNSESDKTSSIKKNILYLSIGFISALSLLAAFNNSTPQLSNKDTLDTSSSPNINVILMISDGFGPASETLARQYMYKALNKDISWKSPLDEILVGSSRTQSSNSLVTDSAAGATAFSCALKSYNGAIAVDDNKRPCGTILEAAKSKGMLTGLVATSRITHATPASFSSHVIHRDMEDLIAEHQIGNYTLGRVIDLMFGGGKCFFLPNSDTESCRSDDRNLLKEAMATGFSTIHTIDELKKIEPSSALPLLGLFTRNHMNYEIDRNPRNEPSLAEMTTKALSIFDHNTKNNNNGFFLMVEGSRIDMSAHSNDASTHLREIFAYWDAVKVVRDFVDKNPNTLMISVSDHETGGISVARQLNSDYPEYLWNPHALTNVTKSNEMISKQLSNFIYDEDASESQAQQKINFIKSTVLPVWMGISDFTEVEVNGLAYASNSTVLNQILSDLVSKRAQIGWATHGHSAVDVNLYAYGYNSEKLHGNVENTDIGSFIKSVLGLDLNLITEKLSKIRTKQTTKYNVSNWLTKRGPFNYNHYTSFD